MTSDERRAKYPGGKVGRARSFAAAQGDSAAGGADNIPPHVTHYPTSVIGRTEPQAEGRMPSECHGLTIISAAHTTPHRLSAVSGEKMNQSTKAVTSDV